MKVSVIIPALNEADRIAQSVRRAWDAGADEVLVVDGGSSDNTAGIAQSQHCRFIATKAGRALQQNTAAKIAVGDILLFLHADNWLAPQAISQIQDALADPRVAHGAFRQRIEANGAAFRLLEWGNSFRVRRLGLPYGDQGLFVRREVFEAIGGFPVMPLLEDFALAKKLRRNWWPRMLLGPLYVDARRWLRHGVMRQTIRNWAIVAAYCLGVSPNRLAKLYVRHDQQSSRRAPHGD